VKVFPIQPLRRVFKKAGAERVSMDALDELRSTLVRMVEEICADALTVAKHANRKTVMKEDVRLATR